MTDCGLILDKLKIIIVKTVAASLRGYFARIHGECTQRSRKGKKLEV
jgi:hypothetical protein